MLSKRFPYKFVHFIHLDVVYPYIEIEDASILFKTRVISDPDKEVPHAARS